MRAKQTWNAEWDVLLGTASTREVAETVGVSYAVVRNRGLKLGIPPKYPRKGGHHTSLLQPHWLPILGTKLDPEHASEFGVSRVTIRNWREKHNIRVFPKLFGSRRIAESLLDTLRYIAHDPSCDRSPCNCGLHRVKIRAESAVKSFNDKQDRKHAK